MGFCVNIREGGMGNTFQDAGRLGFRHQGMPASGFLDAPLAHCANALVGNPANATCVEMRVLGPTLFVTSGALRVAIAGQAQPVITRANSLQQPLLPWHSATLFEGDALRVGAIQNGCAYLSIAGGALLPEAMGSQSTYVRVAVGGLNGRALTTGDSFDGPANPVDVSTRELQSTQPFEWPAGPVRVIAGPQSDHFTADALDALVGTMWTTTAEQDRMGVRLSGQRLTHLTAAHADITSDGIAPGTIQVPGNGLPIVLLADCHTVGGYPKIATVITADLPRMAHMPPGTSFQFQLVDHAQAARALQATDALLTTWVGQLKTYSPPGFLDEKALYGQNLVSGFLRADPLG